MIIHRLSPFFLAAFVAGSLFSQAADNTQRTLTQEGISFKLPAGWQWQSEIAANIAIKKDIKVKDQTYPITAELVYQAEAFLEDSIAGIEKKVAVSKGDLRDLKTTRNEKFNGNNAVLVTLTRARGEKQDQFEDERNYLFRRNNALYTWTERFARQAVSEATPAFAAARQAIVFTKKDEAKANAAKTWAEAGVKYTIPPDFELSEKLGELAKGREEAGVLHQVTAVTVKGQTFLVNCFLGIAKSDETFDNTAKRFKEQMGEQFEGLAEWTTDDKQTFRGEKALMIMFTGVQIPKEERAKPKDPGAPKRQPDRWRMFFVKHKGYMIRWTEVTPVKADPTVEGIIKRARDALILM